MAADFDPTIQSEEIGFGIDEMIACGRCSRQNPPNRLECIYCGAALDVRPEAMNKFSVRKLESWEPGTSVVISGDGDKAKAADLLSLDPDRLQDILACGVPLPVAWVDANAAEIISQKLQDVRFNSSLIPDSELNPVRPPVRIARMTLGDDGLTLTDLNTQREYRHPWSDVVLLVRGIFSAGKIDSMEKRRLRKRTVLSETTTSSDEQVFDLYTADDTTGYRVQLAGFDYSCLGDEMGPLANENISRLIAALERRATNLRVVDDYTRIRHLLTGIWDIESRKDAKGLQQVGFGKREFGVVHSTNNVEQFTRFSRLQRLML